VDGAWLLQARQCRKRSLDGVIDDLREQALEREEEEQASISEEDEDSSEDEEGLSSSLSATPEASIVRDEGDYPGEDLADDNDNDEDFMDAPEFPIEIISDEPEDEDVVEVLEVTPNMEALSIYAAAKMSYSSTNADTLRQRKMATTDFSAASSSSPNSASTDTLVEDTEGLHISKGSAIAVKAVPMVKSKKDYGPRRLRNRAT